ncbi:hypothetical protein QFC20_007598 [Naganishia adeliensis]|uniref:Uncharacterized protein n=1 Tax=Naganishia adeliensis TaxID=92952 RepID=A0ACC2UXA8_9TREE|nr:hypothetical protein QFC20_007598 [Naganishia adeliensis]
MPGVRSKRTVKDESDEEEVKSEPEVKGEEAEVQGEPVKKDENVDELADQGEKPREEEEPPAKKRKANIDPDEEVESHVNDQGEHYIEYYTDKSGEEKPGAKGISLSAEQWQTLKNAIPQIDAWVAAQESSSKKSESNGGSKRGRGRGKGRS